MQQSTIILYSIIVVVLIGIPVVISKKFGIKPMEMLFGKLADRGVFKSDKGESRDKQRRERKQTNSNRNDLLELLSRLATYTRRNHFRMIVPGTLSCDGTIAVLTALIITRSGVVGINCFGFGGRVDGNSGQKDWAQVLNGEEIAFPNPVGKNRNQEKLVRQVLEEVGFAGTNVEIIGVFTSPSVMLMNASGTNCFTRDDALNYLRSDAFLKDGGLEPKALEAALQPRIVRADGKKEEKQTEAEERKEA